ncbi:metal-dependent hydrolase [Thermococcus sp.]|uniref:metal-dependent hydrolase n=1 Tax=Thermococcus sp. TaxID=35749 RepID=UPI00262C0902|nr:metal-dependent hydrolase [Thermococcus sp.]
MDPFEHASIPTLAYLAISNEPTWGGALALILGALFPDLDAFCREHRSYLHSLLFALPVFFLAYLPGNPYALLFSLGWLSHLFLDFFTGVIPPVYPLSRRGWGISITARGGPSGAGLSIRIIEHYPDPRHEYRIEVGGSVALAILAITALIIRLH